MDEIKSFEDFIIAASSSAINNPHTPMNINYMRALEFHRPDLHKALMEYSKPLSDGAMYNPNLNVGMQNMPSFLIFVASRW